LKLPAGSLLPLAGGNTPAGGLKLPRIELAGVFDLKGKKHSNGYSDPVLRSGF
jgi:hypothetical protein